MAYDYSSLEISGVKVEHIGEFKLEARKGEHTCLQCSAVLDPKDKDSVVHKINGDYPVQVKAGGRLIFYGTVTHVEIEASQDSFEIKLEAKSATCGLDQKKCSRTFQDTSMTYHQVIREVMGAYPNADCIIEIPDRPIGELLVQYEETDWEFIKRIASQFGEGIFPYVEREGIRFFAGVPEIPEKRFTYFREELAKDMEAYYRKKAEKSGAPRESDYLVANLDSYSVASLGGSIKWNGKKMYIRGYSLCMEKGLLVGHYEVQKKDGIRQRTLYPMNLVGAALGAKVLDLEGDKVKVKFDIDKALLQGATCPIHYSTMSATSDGTGWYCMPEKGDLVRIYFPTKSTKDAVALSSVSEYTPAVAGGGIEGQTTVTDSSSMAASSSAGSSNSGGAASSSGAGSGGRSGSSGGDRMGDPNTIYFSTIYGKEVRLASDGIRVSSRDGAEVSISPGGTVSLWAQKKIELRATENIEIKATEELQLNALEKIELSCDKGGKLILDDNITLQGIEIKID